MLTPWKLLPLKEIGVLVTEKAKGWGMSLAVDPLRSSEASEQKCSGHVADKGRGASREGGSEAMGPSIFVFKGSFPTGFAKIPLDVVASPCSLGGSGTKMGFPQFPTHSLSWGGTRISP